MKPTTASIMNWPGPWHISLLLRRMLAKNLKSLEYDPHVQYRFHQTFMFVWLVAMIGVAFLPAFHRQVTSLLIMEVSLYANFATDFGAMSSALAAGNYHCAGCNCQKHTKEDEEVTIQGL